MPLLRCRYLPLVVLLLYEHCHNRRCRASSSSVGVIPVTTAGGAREDEGTTVSLTRSQDVFEGRRFSGGLFLETWEENSA